MKLCRLYEFFFSRWKKEVIKQGRESWFHKSAVTGLQLGASYQRDFIDYKYTNKFDGSTKIKRKYLN